MPAYRISCSASQVPWEPTARFPPHVTKLSLCVGRPELRLRLRDYFENLHGIHWPIELSIVGGHPNQNPTGRLAPGPRGHVGPSHVDSTLVGLHGSQTAGFALNRQLRLVTDRRCGYHAIVRRECTPAIGGERLLRLPLR